MDVNKATGEILPEHDKQTNETLGVRHVVLTALAEDTMRELGHIEMELRRRMRESGGRGLPAEGYEIKQTPEIIWDEMQLMTLPEVLSPAEWGEIYTPEGVKPVPSKLNKAKLRQALRKHGENSEPGKIITACMTEIVGKITVEKSE
jgi:hypothetical protein